MKTRKYSEPRLSFWRSPNKENHAQAADNTKLVGEDKPKIVEHDRPALSMRN
jgi:hypothetical protein